MKKYIALLVSVSVALIASVALAKGSKGATADIIHMQGDFPVYLTVSLNALAGHSRHENDCIESINGGGDEEPKPENELPFCFGPE